MSWDVVVEKEVAAPPAKVWAMIADVTRMGEWSPESGNGTWMDGATGPAVGARFKLRNHNGWHRWTVVSEVVACEVDRVFTFEPQFRGSSYSTWSYEVEARDGGCLVRECTVDNRSRFLTVVGRFITGVRERAPHNLVTMTETLDRLAAAAEA